jgi:hypothetical protein
VTTFDRKAAATGAWLFGGLAACLLLLGVFGPPDPHGGQLNLGLVAGGIFGAISLRYTLFVVDPSRQDIERDSSVGIALDILQGGGVVVGSVLGLIRLTQYLRGRGDLIDGPESFGFVMAALLVALCLVGLVVKTARRRCRSTDG